MSRPRCGILRAGNGKPYAELPGDARIELAAAPLSSDGTPVICGVRPEHLDLASDGIDADVVVIEPTGSHTEVVARLAGQDAIAVFRERYHLKPGERIKLRPRPDAVHLFDRKTGRRL